MRHTAQKKIFLVTGAIHVDNKSCVEVKHEAHVMHERNDRNYWVAGVLQVGLDRFSSSFSLVKDERISVKV